MIQFPIEIEVKIKQSGKTIEKKFKILDCFYAKDRYKDIKGNLPETPCGDIDNWLVSKMLCEGYGGRLPSEDELAIISGMAERKIIDLPDGYYWSSVEVSSSQATRRSIYSFNSLLNISSRSYSSIKALCVGD